MSSDVLFIATMSCVFFLLISGYFFLALVFLSFRRSIPDFFFLFMIFTHTPFFDIGRPILSGCESGNGHIQGSRCRISHDPYSPVVASRNPIPPEGSAWTTSCPPLRFGKVLLDRFFAYRSPPSSESRLGHPC